MGQISSPLSMRYSKSMQWPTLWDDKLNFSKKVKVDILTNMFLPLLFNETIYLNKYTNTQLTSFYLNSVFLSDVFLIKDFYENKFFLKKSFFINLDRLTPFFLSFFGKIWIVRFNKWFIIVLYVYSPKKVPNLNQFSKTNLTKETYLNWKLHSTKNFLKKLEKTNLVFSY